MPTLTLSQSWGGFSHLVWVTKSALPLWWRLALLFLRRHFTMLSFIRQSIIRFQCCDINIKSKHNSPFHSNSVAFLPEPVLLWLLEDCTLSCLVIIMCWEDPMRLRDDRDGRGLFSTVGLMSTALLLELTEFCRFCIFSPMSLMAELGRLSASSFFSSCTGVSEQ